LPSLDQPREIWLLDTARIGQRVLVFDSLESTNTTAARMATEDNTDGLALIAEHQTAGRGQYGRVWQSRPGSSLLLSVILRPPRELCRPVILTALAAISVAEAVYTLTATQARLKWPNDLLVRGKKVCGLLIEQHAGVIVLGVGLNLTQSAEEFAAAGLPEATSLAQLSDRPVSLRRAAEVVLGRLDQEYSRLIAGERVAIEADWKWRLGLLGRQVMVERYDGSSEIGRLHEMGFDGLELEVAAGLFRVIVPETVAHVRGL
jgi:BirA family transcriptional regulator, biotin operon repressor / biotin---[acetyl-CoA-carboxylase] ligase